MYLYPINEPERCCFRSRSNIKNVRIAKTKTNIKARNVLFCFLKQTARNHCVALSCHSVVYFWKENRGVACETLKQRRQDLGDFDVFLISIWFIFKMAFYSTRLRLQENCPYVVIVSKSFTSCTFPNPYELWCIFSASSILFYSSCLSNFCSVSINLRWV